MEEFINNDNEDVGLNTPSSVYQEILDSEDNDAPIINIKQKTFKIKANEQFDYMSNVSATDIQDGNLTNFITTNIDEIDFTKQGIKKLEYTVSDKSGNTTTEMVFITVVKDDTNLIKIGQFSFLIIFLLVLIFLIKYLKSIRLEKRFSKYTINSSKNKSISLFDSLYNQYNDFIDKMTKFLSKSKFLKDRAKKYNKYVESFGLDSNIKFISRKIVVGFIFLLVAIIVKLSGSQIMQPYEMIIPFVLGFYTLDIIYICKYSLYRKKIENDMVEAITVMNNAFKSGMSIIQAVDLVSVELNGPIAKEFCKIKQELLFGLDVEISFKRFSNRINTNESIYLATSLSVLNKSGGNIIKVFSSIEENLLNRKKLQNEFKSLTSSSKFIMYVLIFVPIAFVLFISILNNEYFKPLYTTPIGIIMLLLMILIYVSYIITVKHFLKVRM